MKMIIKENEAGFLMMNGVMATVNQLIDVETIKKVALCRKTPCGKSTRLRAVCGNHGR